MWSLALGRTASEWQVGVAVCDRLMPGPPSCPLGEPGRRDVWPGVGDLRQGLKAAQGQKPLRASPQEMGKLRPGAVSNLKTSSLCAVQWTGLLFLLLPEPLTGLGAACCEAVQLGGPLHGVSFRVCV